jgi:phosphate ABC transporter phosphate-binding protein
MTTTSITHPTGIGKTIFVITLIVVAVVSGLTGYFAAGYFRTTPPKIAVNAAGATFPYPFISAVSSNYSSTHNVLINYNPQGSGFGIKQLILKTVDFAASDAPLNAQQAANATNSLHIPETIGAVVVAYDLVQGKGSIPAGLNLTSQVIAKIFQGDITNWNDPSIASLNPGISLPNQSLQSVHRFEGSGTTFVFSSYLNQFSQGVWRLGASTDLSTKWPTGSVAQVGNQGVAGYVAGTAYSIGYVEMNYALQTNMKTANIRTPAGSGNFVKPTLQNVIYAVNNASTTQSLPAGSASWSGVNLLNATGTSSYPIASFTYFLVYKELNVIQGMTLDKARAIVDFLWFVVHDGQSMAPSLYYAKLPSSVVQIDEATIRSITYNGTTLHS